MISSALDSSGAPATVDRLVWVEREPDRVLSLLRTESVPLAIEKGRDKEREKESEYYLHVLMLQNGGPYTGVNTYMYMCKYSCIYINKYYKNVH